MATIKDIAQQAGVSIGTVDRILHNRGRFSVKTADKVRRITLELGYTPNVMARQLSKSKKCHIAVLLPWPEQDSGYWALLLEGIRRAERDLGPFGLTLEILHYDRYESASFLNAGTKLQETDYDGILMAPLWETEALSLLRGPVSELPVIFVDTDLPEARRLSYIGQDSYQSGRLAGRLVNMLTGARAEVGERRRKIVVTPDSDNQHLGNRIRGFIESAEGGVDILRVTVESDHNLDSYHRVLDSTLNSGVSGIFVADASAHFVADYLAGESGDGRAGHSPALVGYDLVPENRKWLRQGLIDFLLTQRPEEQGYNGVNRLFRYLFLSEGCPEFEYTPIDIVAKENLIYLSSEEER